MGSPLDDLRKLTNELEKKKEENLKHEIEVSVKERATLSQQTLEKKLERAQTAAAAKKDAKKSRSRKIIISLSFVLLMTAASITLYIHYTDSMNKLNVLLADKNFAPLKASNEYHSLLKETFSPIINAYCKKSEHPDIRWYPSMPESKKTNYSLLLESKLPGKAYYLKEILLNEKNHHYRLIFKNMQQDLIVLEVIMNNDDLPEVVKVM